MTTTAGVIADFGRTVRGALGTAEEGVISYAGLWLLLAAFGEVADGAHRDRLAEALGMPVDRAWRAAQVLLDKPHDALAAALGAWARPDVPTAGLPGRVEPMPAQAELDAWAARHTRGLIERFPLTVDPDTLIVLATALVAQCRWTSVLDRDDAGLLVLEGGVQTVVDTAAAGPVAVAVPPSRDALDIVSVVAAPDVGAERVWQAADEVAHLHLTGRLDDRAIPGPLTDGHSWTVRETTREFMEWDAPDDGALLWRSHLPSFRVTAEHGLDAAPGVAALAGALRALLPRELDAGDSRCVQSAVAEYTEVGFRAAAVTAFGVGSVGMPRWVERTVRDVDLDFARPHAVVALARGGAWDGVPLFSCWVTADLHTRAAGLPPLDGWA